MINLDALIIEFVSQNWMAIGIALIFLNGICEIIPGKWDDKLVNVFKRMVTFTRQDSHGGGGHGKPVRRRK